ncbi:MAG: hypothetical protein KBE24_11415 [Fusobacteriaceae bacterium]|jgi:uncharacterized tellurite resistance protein B-like protein|nr:hypothetical protein [Clostridia bacterium]MBP9597370.1 hypothetical protein [Fusobacteriaceae bacterium]MBU9919261.1 hypothetical protein [Fusobacteriaceae bacterium]MDD3026085.1 hypothetical protein [Aliarcobacter skirrowii]
MFLNRLEKEEKIAFLELAHYVARSDNDFSDKEKNVINIYCTEMQISDVDFDKSSFNLGLTLSKIKSSQSQKIILLEIMALIYSDNILHQSEEIILQDIINKFQLDSKLIPIYAEWSKAILALSIQGEALIVL